MPTVDIPETRNSKFNRSWCYDNTCIKI